jgi:peptide/nickel transport system permease protein
VRYSARRLLFLGPQLVGVSFVTFFLVRLLPGDPAVMILGNLATEEQLQALRQELGLTEPVIVQYWRWLCRIVAGDWGVSHFTANPVLTDLGQRLPATLELVILALMLACAVMIPLAALLARPSSGWRRRISTSGVFAYGLFAGALPEFWVSLILVYVFYFWMGVAPAPLGRLDVGIAPPFRVTGFLTIDSALARDVVAFRSAWKHLALPVAAMFFVIGGPILRMTLATLQSVRRAEFITVARAKGLSERRVARHALRNSWPPILTMLGLIFSFQLGGAVLVEHVFSWGGIGQYAVQSIANADFWPIQGFVLVGGVLSVLVYLVVDVLHFVSDPRIEP